MSTLAEKRCCKNSSLVTPEQKETSDSVSSGKVNYSSAWAGVRPVQPESSVELQELLQAQRD